jgi:tetratricopeptide (TPR) repeat protein
MGNKLFALLTILVMAVSLIVGCQTVSKKTEPTTLEINPRIAEDYYNRGIAYYFKKEYDKSLENVKKAQELGDKIDPKFLEDLSKASGRKR